MKKLDYRFFYYKTRAAYLSDKAYDRIPNDAIAFVEEGRYIITHDTEYKCSDDPSSPTTVIGDLLQMMFDKKQDKLTAGDNITIEGNVISATGAGGGSVDFEHLTETQQTALETAINQLLTKQTDNTLIETILEKIVERDGEGQNSLIEQITQNIFNTQNMSAEDKEQLASQIVNIINSQSGDNGVYTKSEVDIKVEAAQAGTTPEAISNAVNTYMLNNASEVLSNYITEDDLSDYAKESWVTTQINQHSSGSGSAVPTVNNNTIYFW